MEKTKIENSIKYLTAMRKTFQADSEHLSVAINTMQKYQRINQIVTNKGYWSDKRLLSDIREVIEDGKA